MPNQREASQKGSDSVFGPQYAVVLAPLHIDIQPDEGVDPAKWRAFRTAAVNAVVDLFEQYDLAAAVSGGPPLECLTQKTKP